MATAYAHGAAEAVDKAQARRHRPGCAPVRDTSALAFHIARRHLSGEGHHPGLTGHRVPRRRRRQHTSQAPPRQPRTALLASHLGCSRPLRQEQPALTRWTQARGPVWRAAVAAAAGRLTRGEEAIPPAPQAITPLTTRATVLTEEDMS
jgi:hypothetical protein